MGAEVLGIATGLPFFVDAAFVEPNLEDATYLGISRALSERGIAVLRFDFTGLGHSEGEFANTNFSSNTEDLVSAADHLREQFDAPTLLIGHSLGGAAVLRAAPQIPEVRAIATIGAPSEPDHVRHLFRSSIEEIQASGCARVDLAGREFKIKKQFLDDLEEHNLLAGLRDLRVATAIFHSPIDKTVGIDNAAKIYGALLHPKSFITLDDADHLLTRAEDSRYVADVLAAWADRYLPAPEASTAVTTDSEVLIEQDRGGFLTHITAGVHRLLADEPLSVGGGDRGPNPYEFLLTALGSCTSMTLHMHAKRKQWPLQRVEIRLKHNRLRSPARSTAFDQLPSIRETMTVTRPATPTHQMSATPCRSPIE